GWGTMGRKRERQTGERAVVDEALYAEHDRHVPHSRVTQGLKEAPSFRSLVPRPSWSESRPQQPRSQCQQTPEHECPTPAVQSLEVHTERRAAEATEPQGEREDGRHPLDGARKPAPHRRRHRRLGDGHEERHEPTEDVQGSGARRGSAARPRPSVPAATTKLAPKRLTSAAPGMDAAPRHRTGSAVSAPAVVNERWRSSRRAGRTGGTPRMTERRLKPITAMSAIVLRPALDNAEHIVPATEYPAW